MAVKRTDQFPSHGGVLIQLNLVGIVVFSAALVVVSVLISHGLFATRLQEGGGNVAAGLAEIPAADKGAIREQKDPPPWGQFYAWNIDLEQPFLRSEIHG